jgi:hypothetical protein
MIKMFAIMLLVLGVPYSVPARAIPNGSGTLYMPVAVCNDRTVAFYMTLEGGHSVGDPAQGILSAASDPVDPRSLPSLSAITLRRLSDGGWEFLRQYGSPIEIDRTGAGSGWSRTVCRQQGSATVCKEEPRALTCIFPRPWPTGVSGGN